MTDRKKNTRLPSELLTTGEVSRFLGVAPRTVAKWCERGILPCSRLPSSGDRRIKRSDLKSFAEDKNIPFVYPFESLSPRVLYVGQPEEGEEIKNIHKDIKVASFLSAYEAGLNSYLYTFEYAVFGPGVDGHEAQRFCDLNHNLVRRNRVACLVGGPDLPCAGEKFLLARLGRRLLKVFDLFME